MKKFRQYLILILLTMIFIGAAAVSPRNVYAGLKEDSAGEVAIFGKITNQTDKVRVYIYEDETLKIQNASGIIFQKTYRREGKKTISIPLQKAGTKLEFIVTGTSGFFDYSARIVKDTGTISRKKENPSVPKPVVAGKITDKTKTVKVYAKKGDTLYIQNGAKVIRKASYKKSGYRTIPIKKQEAETKLTFYTVNKDGRSAYVTREVKDVTPPRKPTISFIFESYQDYGWLDVEGERGCDVYIRQNRKHKTGKWKRLGTLLGNYLGSDPFVLHDVIKSIKTGDTFSVRLVDDAGNKSKIATTKEVGEIREDD